MHSDEKRLREKIPDKKKYINPEIKQHQIIYVDNMPVKGVYVNSVNILFIRKQLTAIEKIYIIKNITLL